MSGRENGLIWPLGIFFTFKNDSVASKVGITTLSTKRGSVINNNIYYKLYVHIQNA